MLLTYNVPLTNFCCALKGIESLRPPALSTLLVYLTVVATTSAPLLPKTETLAVPLQISFNKASSILFLPEICKSTEPSSSRTS